MGKACLGYRGNGTPAYATYQDPASKQQVTTFERLSTKIRGSRPATGTREPVLNKNSKSK